MPPLALPSRVPVLIAGGGPVGLTCAALLARRGIASLVVEADPSYCTGSRAICISRRSLEILGWAGAEAAMRARSLPWTGGRSFWRDREVLHFEMPHEPAQRFAPMVNIQQYHVERFVHEALAGSPAQVAWEHRVAHVAPGPAGVRVRVDGPQGSREVQADWLVACDGGRSTVREQLGLALQGTQYEGRYVIVDIEQKTRRPVERLAWFDPPSNPGSTLLMHRQPDDVWRIDYQLREGEDPEAALAPQSIVPRIQSHLDMIGEHEPWRLLWSSMYNAKCLTLPSYRHGRVLFAGDAAHLVPIFGVRGLNSGLDDAANLAWKLALVLQGRAVEGLLDSYSAERVQATHENLAYGAKSTEFMAPPDFAFALMREATLRLALDEPRVRPLINPRQSAPIAYGESPLNGPQHGAWDSDTAAPGRPAPEALLRGPTGNFHLTQRFGEGFTALVFDAAAGPARLEAAGAWSLLRIGPEADPLGQARQRYGVPDGAGPRLVVVRPDGYVFGRWDRGDLGAAQDELRGRGVQP
ncbi:MAG TPA: FAD-dependent monooxygenase [Ramlibacter sp.]|jgi:3-(3-hydroxy-phenyl)propionate hydroxylase|uniref:FAD-dependent monooxygenase n=1 Tax=Ramlibacter sp. TaxID=1917967 RepID=UPI002D5A46ED|nr:FAD-dependent monooxygenase [Ramlibacter sp.]HZY18751.1 FAD-dependent monooxygenase [Ramlibacter sp.]